MSGSDADKAQWIRTELGLSPSSKSDAQSPAARLAALDDKYQAALRAVPAERSALTAAWETAAEQANGADPAAAAKIIDRLTAQIDELLARAPVPDTEKFGIAPGIVAERRSELEDYFNKQIAAAKSSTAGEIGKLTRALDLYIEEPDKLVAAVRAEISGLLDELRGELDEAVQKGAEEDVGEIIALWHERIEAAPVTTALRQVCTDLGVTVAVDPAIGALADSIINKLNLEHA